MTDDDAQFPPEQQVALLHAPLAVSGVLRSFLLFDRRLASFVSNAKEPMLAQMRLAWWRDQLRKPASARPTGDAILDNLSSTWAGEERVLIALVDAWEELLAEPPLALSIATNFTSARAECFAAIARLAGNAAQGARDCGRNWAFADLISKVSDDEERALIQAEARRVCQKGARTPFALRALKILGDLGWRAIHRDNAAMLENRRDVLCAARIGLFGR